MVCALAAPSWGAASYTGFVMGNLQNATNYAVMGSSSSTAAVSVANTAFVDVSTLSVTLRGGRVLLGWATVEIDNGSGAGRTYNVQVEKNGVAISNTYDELITAGDDITISIHWSETSSDTGATVYTLAVNSSNATGTQTATSRIVSALEL